MTPGVIELRGLQVDALVGVLPQELDVPQPVEIDADVHVADVAAAAESDDLADAVDYGEICDVLVRGATAGHVGLLERLAHRLATDVLAVDDRITAVDLTVRKLHPPVAHRLGTSGVRLRIDR